MGILIKAVRLTCPNALSVKISLRKSKIQASSTQVSVKARDKYVRGQRNRRYQRAHRSIQILTFEDKGEGLIEQKFLELKSYDKFRQVFVILIQNIQVQIITQQISFILKFLEISTMQIFLKTQQGKTITIDVQPSDSIETLKKKIQQREKIPSDKQRIIFGARQLGNQGSIRDYNIEKRSTLHLLCCKLVGGGYSSVKFNSLQKPIKKQFSDNAPKWRVVYHGLNLEGKCINQDCEAFDQKVWIQKGYGLFNMNKETNMSKCPICKQICERVNNMGLFMARCVAKGMKKGEKEETEIHSEHKDESNLLTFEDKDQARIDWLYLQLQVKQL